MRISLAVATLSLAGVAMAQKGAACHKGHMDAGYRMTPMPPPRLMKGIGTSSLKITTNSPEAQAYFSQGLALTHCFWDFEAYRAFKEAARLDPDAPMAWWGIVQSIDGYPAMQEEAKAAREKIKKLMDRASEHEKLYLRAQQEQADGKPYLREIELSWRIIPMISMRKPSSGCGLRMATMKTASHAPARRKRERFWRNCCCSIPITRQPIIT